jgi:hypothetical protein
MNEAGTIDWPSAMDLLRSAPGQYPLVLELREVADMENPISVAKSILERLEELPSTHES